MKKYREIFLTKFIFHTLTSLEYQTYPFMDNGKIAAFFETVSLSLIIPPLCTILVIFVSHKKKKTSFKREWKIIRYEVSIN